MDDDLRPSEDDVWGPTQRTADRRRARRVFLVFGIALGMVILAITLVALGGGGEQEMPGMPGMDMSGG